MEEQGFLNLLQSIDAFFPIGAFTLSNGLEDYVLREDIQSPEDLAAYLRGFLNIFAYNDLGIMSLAYRYANDPEFILELDGYGTAMKGASEVRNGAIRMCSRYIKARKGMEDLKDELLWYDQMIREKKAMGLHPIALGLYAKSQNMPLETALTMYGYSVISAIVNNAVKLVPLSQMAGQKVLYEQFALFENAVKKAEMVELEALGISGCAYELHCMNHEQLYSRQYMS